MHHPYPLLLVERPPAAAGTMRAETPLPILPPRRSIASEQTFYGLVFEGELASARGQPEDLYPIGSKRGDEFLHQASIVDFGESALEVSG